MFKFGPFGSGSWEEVFWSALGDVRRKGECRLVFFWGERRQPFFCCEILLLFAFYFCGGFRVYVSTEGLKDEPGCVVGSAAKKEFLFICSRFPFSLMG